MFKLLQVIGLLLGSNQAVSEFSDGSIFYEEELPDLSLDVNVSKTLGDDVFYSGNMPLDHEWQDAFFALFESRNKDTRDEDPLFIWMRGEPGCSPSEFLFGESGIYHQRQNKQTGENDLIKNSHSWNEFTNLLVLDVPIGNGYSFLRGYENSERNYAKDQVIKDFIHFMKHFYLKFPRYRERDLYLAGIDFAAGMYLPYFTQAIEDVKQGKFEDSKFEDQYIVNREDRRWVDYFKLKGVMLGNPQLNQAESRFAAREYAEQNKLLNDTLVSFMMEQVTPQCKEAVHSHDFIWESMVCGVSDSFVTGNPFYALFDIRNIQKQCKMWFTCEEYSEDVKLLYNQVDVKLKLGVQAKTDSAYGDWNWLQCVKSEGFQYKYHYYGQSKNAKEPVTMYQEEPLFYMEKLLNRMDVKVLIYNGDLDYRENYIGIERTIAKDLNWSQKDKMVFDDELQLSSWMYTNYRGQSAIGGEIAYYDNFTYLRVKNAGLQVHLERPDLMFYLVKKWVEDIDGNVTQA